MKEPAAVLSNVYLSTHARDEPGLESCTTQLPVILLFPFCVEERTCTTQQMHPSKTLNRGQNLSINLRYSC